MNAAIITIGDELLIGQVINTNQAYIARQLNTIGIAVSRMLTVGDEADEILRVFNEAWATHDVVLVTGGLGPTHDDITKATVCRFFDSPLESRREIRDAIENLLVHRDIAWQASHEEQTMFPVKAAIVPNPVGTAAGMHFSEHGKHFFVMPGVPYEMKTMMDQTIIPLLASIDVGGAIRHRTLRTTGATESHLAALLGNVNDFLHGATLAFLPSPTGVRLRISVQESSADVADRKVAEIETYMREKVGTYVYGVDDQELEEVLGTLLASRGFTIATAESCTGGLIAHRITGISGSSGYFERGVVTYSNASKCAILGVPEPLIREFGAVSEQVAVAMAEGIRGTAGTDIGVSTTGVAGPTGGTPEKPVGLVWIGYADVRHSFARRFTLGNLRSVVKERAAQSALELVWRELQNDR